MWAAARESPSIPRSYAVKLGMTSGEAEAAMNIQTGHKYLTGDGERGLIFRDAKSEWRNAIEHTETQFGVHLLTQSHRNWVRIRFDSSGRVDLIDRGGDVEVSTH